MTKCDNFGCINNSYYIDCNFTCKLHKPRKVIDDKVKSWHCLDEVRYEDIIEFSKCKQCGLNPSDCLEEYKKNRTLALCKKG